ncbi:Protein kinase domain-containing protein ppk32, partial [Polyrhizophydium stewartii]
MGNALATQFDVQEQSRLWQVRKAVAKSSGKTCAVWSFDRAEVERRNPHARQSHIKNEMSIVSELLKREVQTLTKLRHPSILQVQEQLQELRTMLAFATEPLMDTLSNALAFTQSHRSGLQPIYELDTLEIQKGLKQVAGGLMFLHSANIVHLNLCPDAILINPKGDWKIAGFQHAVSNPAVSARQADIVVEGALNPAHQPASCTPNLSFVAPEVVLDGVCTTASDVWSLGVLIYSLFNSGQPLFECHGNQYTYRERANGMLMIGVLELRNVPAELEAITASMLPMSPRSRITLEQFQSSHYFENVLMNTLEGTIDTKLLLALLTSLGKRKYVESLIQKPEIEKAKFLKALPALLPRFPDKIVQRKMLPLLLDELRSIGVVSLGSVMTDWCEDAEFAQNYATGGKAPFVLPCVFWIIERSSGEALQMAIRALRPLFLVMDPPQCALLLLSKTDLLANKFPGEASTDIVPFVVRCLESPHPVLQEAGVKSIVQLLGRVDGNTVRTLVLPKLEHTFQTTPHVATKVNCLIALHGIVKILDKHDVAERVLPLL